MHCHTHVGVVEYLGDEQLVHLTPRDTPVRAKLSVDERTEHGTEMEFSIRRDKLHVFDAETEERVSGF